MYHVECPCWKHLEGPKLRGSLGNALFSSPIFEARIFSSDVQHVLRLHCSPGNMVQASNTLSLVFEKFAGPLRFPLERQQLDDERSYSQS